MTPKQKKYFDAIASGLTEDEARMEAGYTPKDKIVIRNTDEQFKALVDSLIPDNVTIQNLVKLTKAKKLTKYGTDSDNPSKLLANKLLLQLKGRLIERFEHIGTIDINVELKAEEQIIGVAERLLGWWDEHYAGRPKLPDNFVVEKDLLCDEEEGPTT